VSPRETAFASTAHPRLGRSVSLDDAAELLGVSRRTIYNRIRRGNLETVRTIGGSQRVLIDSIERTRSGEMAQANDDALFFRSGWASHDRPKRADAKSPNDRLQGGEHKEARWTAHED
jgi:excisionase family DNA binding protein